MLISSSWHVKCLVWGFNWTPQDNRPFARSGHMVRNKLCWDASYTVGTHSNPAQLSFVLKVPLCKLCISIIYSIPCDRIVQRAYGLKCRFYYAATRKKQLSCNLKTPTSAEKHLKSMFYHQHPTDTNCFFDWDGHHIVTKMNIYIISMH